jgi:hypothetical protein
VSLVLLAAGFWVSSCAVPIGPGYSIESQEIRVHFVPTPTPKIHVDADYRLRNTGNQPLSSLELRLPARRRFHISQRRILWDDTALSEQTSPGNPRETLLALPRPWHKSERHTLHLSAELENPPEGETGLTFSPDAFFLPSEGWAPELLPSRGLFATGGVPPKTWRLVVNVPQGFLAHMSGIPPKTSAKGSGITLRAMQRPEDHYPFVVSGRYTESAFGSGNEKIYLWTRAQQESAVFHESGDKIVSAIGAFDAAFGIRDKSARPFWIVECPVPTGCITAELSTYAGLLGEETGQSSSALVSQDSAMVNLGSGVPQPAIVAPALAASWLGYGQNPGFYEQEPPLSALPAFAVALGREAVEGPTFRTETIRRVLRVIPRNAEGGKKEGENVLRAKSFLFFYALQDRYGPETFHNALHDMLSARKGRGFNLSDLIASFGDQTHQNVAEFVRLWMKRPGVPDEFRSRYEGNFATNGSIAKETTP